MSSMAYEMAFPIISLSLDYIGLSSIWNMRLSLATRMNLDLQQIPIYSIVKVKWGEDQKFLSIRHLIPTIDAVIWRRIANATVNFVNIYDGGLKGSWFTGYTSSITKKTI